MWPPPSVTAHRIMDRLFSLKIWNLGKVRTKRIRDKVSLANGGTLPGADKQHNAQFRNDPVLPQYKHWFRKLKESVIFHRSIKNNSEKAKPWTSPPGQVLSVNNRSFMVCRLMKNPNGLPSGGKLSSMSLRADPPLFSSPFHYEEKFMNLYS